MVILYGIKNCDTVKKARLWLTANNVEYRFHDFQVDGITPELVRRWALLWGTEALLNKRGTTWRKLSETDIVNLTEAKAITLMLKHSSVIKRPILDDQGKMKLGFEESEWAELFHK